MDYPIFNYLNFFDFFLSEKATVFQGMNEIIGPIYYVLSSDPDMEWSKYAEHDTFYCFTRVMSEIRDNFIQSMDESTSGIHANMSKGILRFGSEFSNIDFTFILSSISICLDGMKWEELATGC